MGVDERGGGEGFEHMLLGVPSRARGRGSWNRILMRRGNALYLPWQ
jgi:hypothetical protein